MPATQTTTGCVSIPTATACRIDIVTLGFANVTTATIGPPWRVHSGGTSAAHSTQRLSTASATRPATPWQKATFDAGNPRSVMSPPNVTETAGTASMPLGDSEGGRDGELVG